MVLKNNFEIQYFSLLRGTLRPELKARTLWNIHASSNNTPWKRVQLTWNLPSSTYCAHRRLPANNPPLIITIWVMLRMTSDALVRYSDAWQQQRRMWMWMAVREIVRGRKKQRVQPIVASLIPSNGKQVQATRPRGKGQVARNKKIAVIASAQAKERAKCRRPSLGPGMPRSAACCFACGCFVARMLSNVFETRLDRFHGNDFLAAAPMSRVPSATNVVLTGAGGSHAIHSILQLV